MAVSIFLTDVLPRGMLRASLSCDSGSACRVGRRSFAFLLPEEDAGVAPVPPVPLSLPSPLRVRTAGGTGRSFSEARSRGPAPWPCSSVEQGRRLRRQNPHLVRVVSLSLGDGLQEPKTELG